jgi:hypothetical protein
LRSRRKIGEQFIRSFLTERLPAARRRHRPGSFGSMAPRLLRGANGSKQRCQEIGGPRD